MNVFQATEDLEQDAFNNSTIKRLVIPGLHQLIEVAVHVLHGDVQLLAKRVQEYIIGRHKMGMSWYRLEEYDFSEVHTLREGFEGLLHGLNGNL